MLLPLYVKGVWQFFCAAQHATGKRQDNQALNEKKPAGAEFPAARGRVSPGTRARYPGALISGIGFATIGDSNGRLPGRRTMRRIK